MHAAKALSSVAYPLFARAPPHQLDLWRFVIVMALTRIFHFFILWIRKPQSESSNKETSQWVAEQVVNRPLFR